MYILLQFMKEKNQFNCDMCDSCYKSKLGLKNMSYQFMKIKDLVVQNALFTHKGHLGDSLTAYMIIKSEDRVFKIFFEPLRFKCRTKSTNDLLY